MRKSTPMICGCSHLVIASKDVPRMSKFFSSVFSIQSHFENEMFSEFILPNKFRIAFFQPVGPASNYFSTNGTHDSCGMGITVDDVDVLYAHAMSMPENFHCTVSGPPKNHPWGERSFLLIDHDGNRWEITQSPSADGFLIEKPQVKRG